jgi:hypothetical protein
MLGGYRVPLDGLSGILLNAIPVLIHDADVTLRARDSLLGGYRVPLDGLSGILLNAIPVLIRDADVTLRFRVSLLGAYSDDSAHLFRRKPPTCSEGSRPPIPIDSAHPFRWKPVVFRSVATRVI